MSSGNCIHMVPASPSLKSHPFNQTKQTEHYTGDKVKGYTMVGWKSKSFIINLSSLFWLRFVRSVAIFRENRTKQSVNVVSGKGE